MTPPFKSKILEKAYREKNPEEDLGAFPDTLKDISTNTSFDISKDISAPRNKDGAKIVQEGAARTAMNDLANSRK